MLKNNDKIKIEQYIEKIVFDIQKDLKSWIPYDRFNIMNSLIHDKLIVNKVINVIVDRFALESKKIRLNVYNMMMEQTLQENVFYDVKNKAAFYDMNILKELNEKFEFVIPQVIDCKDSKNKFNSLMALENGIVLGGRIFVPNKNRFFFGIDFIILLIKLSLINNKNNNNDKTFDIFIEEYLDNVKKSLLLWIDTIEQYYDGRVNQLNKMLESNIK